MIPEVFTSVGAFLLLFVGLFLFYVGWLGMKMSMRARKLPGRPSYNETVDTSGIFVEHGMVYNPDTGELEAQQKPSEAWYELFFRR
jgi:hypothetical protein